jgi:dipeptide/tripeptide permease
MAESLVRPQGFLSAFSDLRQAPRALWIYIGAFVFDTTAYFGMLTLMTTYLASGLAWGDAPAGLTVSLYTMLVTLFMLGIGGLAESLGLRRAVVLGLAVMIVGRVLYSAAGGLNAAAAVTAVLGAVLLMAAASAVLQPVCYSAVKQYTDERTSSMGFGLIYALMNLGIVGIAALSSWLRPGVQAVKDGQAQPQGLLGWMAGFSRTGVEAVNWACTALSLLTLLLFVLLIRRRDDACRLRPETTGAGTGPGPGAVGLGPRMATYFREGPFGNLRFVFFIFMLLPVRTLFAHQWLTFPQYILRAYPQGIADRMEWLVNWINPLIIFLGVPVLTALTRRINVYTLMIVGSLVSAAPTFLLCGGPSLGLLIAYFVVFSIGEALWSARFLEYAAELAPAGRVAQYMGLAQIPWLLAKGTTGLYSGLLLARYCPENVAPAEMRTDALWFIYGCIAMLSPIGLWLARHWVRAGLRSSKASLPS